MNTTTDPRHETRAKVLKAMAHPSRLIMLEALESGELCVCELQELVGADMSTVSKHLSVLKQVGLVSDRKQGLKIFYKLRVPCALQFMHCIDAVLGTWREGCETELPVLNGKC